MSRLTRDGIAEPVSRDQSFRRANGDREIFIFPVQVTTSRIGNLTRLILNLAIYVMTIYKYSIILERAGLEKRREKRHIAQYIRYIISLIA